MVQFVVKYRNALTIAVFAIWMVFFDQNNLVDQYRLRSQVKNLKREKGYYLEEMEKARKEYEELFTNEESLEKFAREKYLMKRENEDIFVIEKR